MSVTVLDREMYTEAAAARRGDRGFWEHEGAGESIEEIANEFGVAPDLVVWALAYETSARARAA